MTKVRITGDSRENERRINEVACPLARDAAERAALRPRRGRRGVVARLPARAVLFLAGSQLPLALLARQARQVPTLYICIRMCMHAYALVCMCVYMHTVWQRQADAH